MIEREELPLTQVVEKGSGDPRQPVLVAHRSGPDVRRISRFQ
jgi:hypothetical protein